MHTYLHSVSGTIGVIQGDLRQDYLAKKLRAENLPVLFIENPESASFAACSILMAPIPFTKDQKTLSAHPELSVCQFLSLLHPGQTLFGGNLPPQVREYCRKHAIAFCDFMDMEEVARKNAVATAEGAISEALAASPVNLEGSPCLLAGYGRCGQVIAKKLKALGAKITILEKDPEKQNLAKKEGFSCIQSHALTYFLENNSILFLINTIPCPLFGEPLLEKTPPGITIIDIASAPGGVDFDYCKKTGRGARLCPGLPGKYAPETSAKILYEALTAYLDMQNNKNVKEVPL